MGEKYFKEENMQIKKLRVVNFFIYTIRFNIHKKNVLFIFKKLLNFIDLQKKYTKLCH